MVDGNSLNLQFCLETLDGVTSFQDVQLALGVLLYETLDRLVATTDSDQGLIIAIDFDGNSLLSETVHTLRLPQKHDLHLFLLGLVPNVLCKDLVNLVSFPRNIGALELVNLFV